MSNHLEQKIMSQIKSGRVKLRSKYIFLAEKLGFNSALALTIILAILFFNLALFYIKATDNLEYLSFGKKGILAFLESFPYLLVISLIVFLLLSGYLMTKADWSYKKPFKYFAVGLIIFVLFIGGILAWTNISKKIEEQAFERRIPGIIFKPFLKRGLEPHDRGIAGKIREVGDNCLIIETPHGLQNIDIKSLEFINGQKFEKGQFIMAIGKRMDNVFVADRIRIMNEDRMPMIRRGIHRQFGPFPNAPLLPPPLLNFNEETKGCN